MSVILGPIKKAIQKQADEEGGKLLNGQFTDYAGAKGLVERRNGLLKAIEILEKQSKHDDESEGI